ncbi:MAG: hypothetical protein IKP21_01580 [Bacteroidales bacterium]|nr:hypothetical protein [Bacteroidales bacterium]
MYLKEKAKQTFATGLFFTLLCLLLPLTTTAQTDITSLSSITDADAHYRIAADISGGTPGVSTFNGTLEAAIDPSTHMPYRISGLTAPLFTTLTGTVKNLVLEGVAISGHSGNTGAVACTANVAARIYNVGILDGEVGGTGYTGGLVGLLAGNARVINCYSYATITGGSTVGGIVGRNNVATTAATVTTGTMVMNCMFYGDITGGSAISPVYGGQNINNLNSGGLTTFNYYAYDELVTKKVNNNNYYNCALAVEERYLKRFEFYRLLLNSNKKLAAWYATGSVDDGGQMLKWVLETADRTIANPKPYPILKAQGYYPSIINPDFANAPDSTDVGRNHGGKLGKTLIVTINKAQTDGGQTWPTGASITTDTLTLTRTDMDGDRFNYNYDKVQLPYYNDIGTGNYTGGRVVTGWKITAFSGGTAGTYTASDSWGGYNFADRNCTDKDKYSVSGRVFAQGAYYDVPYGVDTITIEPYWGYASFLADQYYDVVFKSDYTREDVTAFGNQVESTTSFNGVSVKYTVNDALGTIATKGTTVYDNAVVLVGNFHQTIIYNKAPFNGSTPFTLMSVDLDNDHEPDYSLIYHDNNRSKVCPIRFDFLNIPGTAQAQKPNGSGTVLNASVFNASSWFEITNTSLIYFSQFEYENTTKTAPAPIILLGGVFDQFTSTKTSEVKNTTYLLVGGNAWFKDFANGTHSDGSSATTHIPISVTGGDYKGFYLTGTYVPNATVKNDDAECYVSGGHFIEAAGAGQEQIGGNVRWQIYNADIENFYGGGINSGKPIKGNITVDITNSHVGTYCGGPKFGDMQSGKTVTTTATGCTFGKFFGAGFGGTAISKVKYYDKSTVEFSSWQEKYYKSDNSGDRGKYFDGTSTNASYDSGKNYGKKGIGVATDFDYEFFVWTSGTTGGRFFVKFASFSLAQCNDVVSTLKKCTINGNFYGGGSLGSVAGSATSVLDSCTVNGDVYGAGFSATLPTLQVRNEGFASDGNGGYKVPSYNKYSGMFEPGEVSGTTEFHWKHVNSLSNNTTNISVSNDTNYVHTTVDLNSLGSVNGNITLTLKGNTTVTGSVFGGGEESAVNGDVDVQVILQDETTVNGNVFGGGNEGAVEGNTKVILKD